MFGKKTAIIFFSHQGHTKRLVESFPVEEGDLIYEIKPAQEYPSAYFKTLPVAKAEFKGDIFSEISSKQIDLANYDNILLGFPIWYSTAPRIIFTFLKDNEMGGKKVYPFCTSTMGGISKAVSDIRNFCPDSDVKKGKRIKKYSEETLKGLLNS